MATLPNSRPPAQRGGRVYEATPDSSTPPPKPADTTLSNTPQAQPVPERVVGSPQEVQQYIQQQATLEAASRGAIPAHINPQFIATVALDTNGNPVITVGAGYSVKGSGASASIVDDNGNVVLSPAAIQSLAAKAGAGTTTVTGTPAAVGSGTNQIPASFIASNAYGNVPITTIQEAAINQSASRNTTFGGSPIVAQMKRTAENYQTFTSLLPSVVSGTSSVITTSDRTTTNLEFQSLGITSLTGAKPTPSPAQQATSQIVSNFNIGLTGAFPILSSLPQFIKGTGEVIETAFASPIGAGAAFSILNPKFTALQYGKALGGYELQNAPILLLGGTLGLGGTLVTGAVAGTFGRVFALAGGAALVASSTAVSYPNIYAIGRNPLGFAETVTGTSILVGGVFGTKKAYDVLFVNEKVVSSPIELSQFEITRLPVSDVIVNIKELGMTENLGRADVSVSKAIVGKMYQVKKGLIGGTETRLATAESSVTSYSLSSGINKGVSLDVGAPTKFSLFKQNPNAGESIIASEPFLNFFVSGKIPNFSLLRESTTGGTVTVQSAFDTSALDLETRTAFERSGIGIYGFQQLAGESATAGKTTTITIGGETFSTGLGIMGRTGVSLGLVDEEGLEGFYTRFGSKGRTNLDISGFVAKEGAKGEFKTPAEFAKTNPPEPSHVSSEGRFSEAELIEKNAATLKLSDNSGISKTAKPQEVEVSSKGGTSSVKVYGTKGFSGFSSELSKAFQRFRKPTQETEQTEEYYLTVPQQAFGRGSSIPAFKLTLGTTSFKTEFALGSLGALKSMSKITQASKIVQVQQPKIIQTQITTQQPRVSVIQKTTQSTKTIQKQTQIVSLVTKQTQATIPVQTQQLVTPQIVITTTTTPPITRLIPTPSDVFPPALFNFKPNLFSTKPSKKKKKLFRERKPVYEPSVAGIFSGKEITEEQAKRTKPFSLIRFPIGFRKRNKLL